MPEWFRELQSYYRALTFESARSEGKIFVEIILGLGDLVNTARLGLFLEGLRVVSIALHFPGSFDGDRKT